MKIKLWKRLGACLLAISLFTMTSGHVLADTISDIEARQEELEQEKADLANQLEALRNDEASKQAYQEKLQEQIDVVEEQIDSARRDIDSLNSRITELTMRLQKSQEEIQSTIDQFKERLKALYKAGDVGTVEILLSSDSFSDFTMRSELIRTMTLHDQELMQKIEDYMDGTKAEREECERSKAKVAELKKQMENQQEELDGLYQENLAAIAELETAQANTQKLIEDNEAELADNEQKMLAAIEEQKRLEEERKQQQQQNEYMGGNVTYPVGGGGVEGFNPIWPLPGVSYVSCYYGGYAGHRGMDIAGPYGTPVVAAESGTVIAANDYDSWGDSWGYYVLIYHNGTFTTRYAHLSALAVSNGQWVEQGTIVGYEGDTGNVTGPHLHFEVYENGSRVDPMNYL